MAAGEVQRLAQAVTGRGGISIGPQHIYQLIAHQRVIGLERQTLDELGRIATAPGAFWQVDTAAGYSKTPEHLEPQSHRPCRS